MGRYSFIGVRPRGLVRWSLGDDGDPYALAEQAAALRQATFEDAPPFTGGAVGFFGYDLVRTVETTLGEPNPDVLGLPDMALMLSDVLVVFDHLKHTVTILVNVAADDLEESYADAVATIADTRRLLDGPVPEARGGPSRPAGAGVPLQHAARAVRGHGRADRRVRPRRRRVPGRAVPALERAAGGHRPVLGLPRAAGGQPVALHVLPGLPRLPGRRRLARAAADGHRPPRVDSPDRRHAAARRRPRRAAGRREGALRARDARRPRAQRPRPRLRVRQRRTSTSSCRSSTTRTSCTSSRR